VVELAAQIAAKLYGDVVPAELPERCSEDFAHQPFRPIAIDRAARAFPAGDNAEAWVMQVIRARA
jgi:hypothetical protein